MKNILMLLCGFVTYGQQMHHQMISSQGAVITLNDGIRVMQTIGQQSVIGNFVFNNNIVGQGFQQSNKPKSVISTKPVITITYPNPFIDNVTFKFSQQMQGIITISIMDVAGKVLFLEERLVSGNTLTIENLYFASGAYFISLSAKNYKYTTTILKGKF